jgi:uncharacterized protein (TIGR02001 family)
VPAPTPPTRRRRVIALEIGALAVAAAGAAHAQIAVSAAVESDYRFRGSSLTDSRPAGSLNFAYDHASGFYAGATALVAATRHEGLESLGFIEYAGVVKRVMPEVAVDVGVTNYDLKRYAGARTVEFDYVEAYAGLVTRNATLRGAFSPNYLRPGAHTLYLDFSGAVHPWEKWRLFGHAGLFAPANGEARRLGFRRRYDLRAGIAREFDKAQLSLAWTTMWPRFGRPGAPGPKQSAVVASASYYF